MKHNIYLIADSGSTKTDWAVIENNQLGKVITTKGMNPVFQSADEMVAEITENLLPHLPTKHFSNIFFYGAGCIPEKVSVVENALRQVLTVDEKVEVNSDLLAAARALCGKEPGIACILGTGSNSCFYDGTQIAWQVPALGFILGDEGSGANLGKRLVSDLLKNQLDDQLKEEFFAQFNTNMADIIENVYRKPFPSRYLASLNVFLEQHKTHKAVHELLVNAFSDFIRRNVMQYDYHEYPMNCIGTIALVYQSELTEAAQALGVKIGTISKAPMEGLLKYHTL